MRKLSNESIRATNKFLIVVNYIVKIRYRLHAIRNGLRAASHLGAYGANPIQSLKFLPSVTGSGDYAFDYSVVEEDNLLPVPPQNLWLGYGSTEQEYLDSGKQDVDKMVSILQDANTSIMEKSTPILDLGCGGGRMIRHLRPYAKNREIWGLDISAPHISWLKTHLSPPFHFAVNTTIPHLPFSDNYFELVYCGSLFTHIDDLADAWFLEVKRVLSPGGILFCTLHDDLTLDVLSNPNKYPITRTISQSLLSKPCADRPDVFVSGRGSDCNVFYRSRYLEHLLPAFFSVKSVVQAAYGYQTAWVLEKRREAR